MPKIYNQQYGAKCPKCERGYQWDWCGDLYKMTSGPYCKETKIAETTHMFECPCGAILGFSVLLKDEHRIISCHEWRDVDWDSNEMAA